MKDTVKFAAGAVIGLLATLGFIYLIYQVGYQTAKNEQQSVIVYQTDNAGAAMFGKITDKEIIEGRYTVTAGAYGKFIVKKEQYEDINVGDQIPDYLKQRGMESNEIPGGKNE